LVSLTLEWNILSLRQFAKRRKHTLFSFKKIFTLLKKKTSFKKLGQSIYSIQTDLSGARYQRHMKSLHLQVLRGQKSRKSLLLRPGLPLNELTATCPISRECISKGRQVNAAT
jgi:hypothetical protein